MSNTQSYLLEKQATSVYQRDLVLRGSKLQISCKPQAELPALSGRLHK